VIGHLGRADRAEEDRVERLQLLEAAGGNVGAGFQIALRAPVEVLELEPDPSASFFRTSIPAGMTSLPMPSPGMEAIL